METVAEMLRAADPVYGTADFVRPGAFGAQIHRRLRDLYGGHCTSTSMESAPNYQIDRAIVDELTRRLARKATSSSASSMSSSMRRRLRCLRAWPRALIAACWASH